MYAHLLRLPDIRNAEIWGGLAVFRGDRVENQSVSRSAGLCSRTSLPEPTARGKEKHDSRYGSQLYGEYAKGNWNLHAS